MAASFRIRDGIAPSPLDFLFGRVDRHQFRKSRRGLQAPARSIYPAMRNGIVAFSYL